MSKFIVISLFSSALLFTACSDNNVLYTKAYTFKNNTWEQDVKPVFKVEIKDTSLYYTMNVTIRITTDYLNSNLWFFMHSKAPNGETGREPYEVKVANPDGSWSGKTTGTIVENTVSFKHRKFPQKGIYYFTFEQGITEKTITNIMDISCSVSVD